MGLRNMDVLTEKQYWVNTDLFLKGSKYRDQKIKEVKEGLCKKRTREVFLNGRQETIKKAIIILTEEVQSAYPQLITESEGIIPNLFLIRFSL